MRTVLHGAVVLAAAACVGGFLLGGTAVVLALVLAGVAALTWQVAAASRPRPRGDRGAGGAGSARLAPEVVSDVRIGDQRDAHVVHDERRQGEGVEDLMEAEPPR